jgi:hypothetical protein
MLISAGMLGFVILGMFFAMLTSSPKAEVEPQAAESRDRLPQ